MNLTVCRILIEEKALSVGDPMDCGLGLNKKEKQLLPVCGHNVPIPLNISPIPTMLGYTLKL